MESQQQQQQEPSLTLPTTTTTTRSDRYDDPRPTGLPVPPISIDSPAFAFAYLQSAYWDEGLSMNLTRPTVTVVLAAVHPDPTGSPFSYHRFQNQTKVFLPASDAPAVDDATFARDMTRFLKMQREDGRSDVPVSVHAGVGPFADVSDHVFETLGFEQQNKAADHDDDADRDPHFAVRRFADRPPRPV
ncbi:hypothetical protein HKX48_003274, partial [Thoreauomyces humboldtii]